MLLESTLLNLDTQTGTLTFECDNISEANTLWRNRCQLANAVRHFPQVKRISLKVGGRWLFPPFKPSDLEPHMALLLSTDASFQAILDFIQNSPEPAEVTSMITNTTLLLNDKYTPDRLNWWKPAQLIGFNCLYYWQDDRESFEILLRTLRQEGRIRDFKFKNRRLDGSIGEFVKDYHLVENFLGDPVRISVSRDWRILTPAPEPIPA